MTFEEFALLAANKGLRAAWRELMFRFGASDLENFSLEDFVPADRPE